MTNYILFTSEDDFQELLELLNYTKNHLMKGKSRLGINYEKLNTMISKMTSCEILRGDTVLHQDMHILPVVLKR